MTLANSGLIGGVVGFGMSTVMYLAASFALKRGRPPAGKSAEEHQRSMSTVRLILLADIPILTGMGYFVGQTFA